MSDRQPTNLWPIVLIVVAVLLFFAWRSGMFERRNHCRPGPGQPVPNEPVPWWRGPDWPWGPRRPEPHHPAGPHHPRHEDPAAKEGI